MMATTHAFVGALLASATMYVAPEAAPVAMLAGFVGGILPDLDLFLAHRRDLHFPVYAWVPTAGALALAAAIPTTATLATAAFFVAFAVHPVMDIFGGSTEPEPWKRTTDRAVYNHYLGRWHRARRVVRFDGAPEDLSVAAFSAAGVLLVATGPVHDLVLAALAVSIAYTLVRRRLLDIVAALRASLPASVERLLPERDR